MGMLTKIAKWLEGGEPRFNDRDPDAFERLVGIATGGQGRTASLLLIRELPGNKRRVSLIAGVEQQIAAQVILAAGGFSCSSRDTDAQVPADAGVGLYS
jgi:hypothetical protein